MADKLQLIQAGVGGMGRTWWKNAVAHSPDFEVAALVDIADEPLREAGDALGVPEFRRYKDLATALGETRADALLTVTPPLIHSVHARLAFDHGLHVLTEKPIADTLDNAQKMVAWARAADRQLVVAQNYRFSPGARKLRDLVRDAPLGALGHGHLDFYIPGDFAKTFRGTMQFPLLVDMAIHHLDLVRAVAGRNITQVTARSFRPAWSWYQHDPGLKLLMELEGNLPFSYSGDWSAFGRPTTWNGSWRLQCEKGNIAWEDDKLALHRSEFWGGHHTTENVDLPTLPLTAQPKLLADFADAIRTHTPAETSGQDNLHSFATVMAAVRSAKEQRAVPVAELLAT